MTVAAYSRGVLAADTCYTHQDDASNLVYRVRATKITVIRDVPGFTLAVVTAGDDAYTGIYERAVRSAFTAFAGVAPKEFELLFDREFDLSQCPSAIVMFRSGADSGAYSGEAMLRRIPSGGYAAIGADAPVALGALFVGVGAVDAVKAGVFHGVMSAGPVEYLCSTFFEVRSDACT